MKNIKKAFTLSELLLAVAIIGVIAALTIPNLNKNINEEKYISLMKSTMGQLDAAVAKVVAEYGSLAKASKSCDGNIDYEECLGDVLTSYLDLRKNCTTSVSDCFSSDPLLDYKGNAIAKRPSNSAGCEYTFILSNGVAACLRTILYHEGFSKDDFIRSNGYKSHIDIDVDGPKEGPNMRGVDNFDFVIDNDGVTYFTYADNEDYDGNRDSDRGFNKDYDSVSWAFLNNNMDYLRCADDLKWYSKKTCD